MIEKHVLHGVTQMKKEIFKIRPILHHLAVYVCERARVFCFIYLFLILLFTSFQSSALNV